MKTDKSRQIARHLRTWAGWIMSCLCCLLFLVGQGRGQADQGTITELCWTALALFCLTPR
jgi:hypothetical protein